MRATEGLGQGTLSKAWGQLTSYESLQPPTFLENGLKKLCQSSSEMIVRQIFQFGYKCVIFASRQQLIFFTFFTYDIQHCFICRPSDSTVSEDAGIEPRTVATTAVFVIAYVYLRGLFLQKSKVFKNMTSFR